jgi:CheY-like chemotaxis protein
MGTILIVDDEAGIREAFRDIVELLFDDEVSAGRLTVQTASDGENAVAMASISAPDVMLMDVNMPRMDGITAFERITATLGRAVPTIFITGFANTGPVGTTLAELQANHAVAVLAKPVDASDLNDAIRAMLSRTP